jgi:hypothetical protein
MSYVLVVLFIVSRPGVATTTVEFASEELCEAARKDIEKIGGKRSAGWNVDTFAACYRVKP